MWTTIKLHSVSTLSNIMVNYLNLQSDKLRSMILKSKKYDKLRSMSYIVSYNTFNSIMWACLFVL